MTDYIKIESRLSISHRDFMATLVEVQNAADLLSEADRAKLAAYLLNKLPSPSHEVNDEEVNKRDEEMDSGEVKPLTHEEFLIAIGR